MSCQRERGQPHPLGPVPLYRRNNASAPLIINGKRRTSGPAFTLNGGGVSSTAAVVQESSGEASSSLRSCRTTTMPSTTTMTIAAVSTTATATTSGGRSLRLITICLVTLALFTKLDTASAYPSLMILPRPSSSSEPLFGEIRSSGAFNAIHRPVPSAEVTPPNSAQEVAERVMMGGGGDENANNNDAVEKARKQEKAQPEFINARKRAFDRLDVSPFDFEALSKRFNDDDNDFFYGRRRRAFDRFDDNPFFELMTRRRRRSFDRLEDGPFLLGKRSQPAAVASFDDTANENNTPLMVVELPVVAKRPFDRLEYSTFGMTKRNYRRPLSITDLVRQLDVAEGDY